MAPYKYTEERLRAFAPESTSVLDLMRRLGGPTYPSGSYQVRRWLDEFGIDTSHFTGRAHGRGKPSPRRKSAEEILVLRTAGRKTAREQLRRALLNVGVPERCSECGLRAAWNGKPLVLHIDHVNGNWRDNRRENLRFLCPNCHSQTPTYGYKNTAAYRTANAC